MEIRVRYDTEVVIRGLTAIVLPSFVLLSSCALLFEASPQDAGVAKDDALGRADGAPPVADAAPEPDASLLSCDPGFTFDPPGPVHTMANFRIYFEDQEDGYIDVGFSIFSPGNEEVSLVTVVESGEMPYRWSAVHNFGEAGEYRVEFIINKMEPEPTVYAFCEFEVYDQ